MKWMLGSVTLLVSACLPPIYVVDRPTMMMSEAAGDWPKLDRQFYSQGNARGPEFLSGDQTTKKRAVLHNTLNAEMVADAKRKTVKAPVKAPAKKSKK